LNRQQKEEAVEKLTATLAEAQGFFLTDFNKLKVEQLGQLRNKVREAGGHYQVVKNTLLTIAVKGTESEKVTELLSGNNGLGWAMDDPAAVAKALVNFAKQNDKLVIKGGVLSGQVVNSEQVKAIADLPSREVLLATLLGTMNAVPTGFVRLLAAIPQKMLYALTAIKDQKAE
jgi:large subunit ribosomal protein L10